MRLDSEDLKNFALHLRGQGKQAATIESYRRDAATFVEYLDKHKLPLEMVEPATLVAFEEYLRFDLEERHNSIRRTIIGIRQFFRYLEASKRITATPFDIVPLPERDERLEALLSDDDLEDLFRVAQATEPSLKATRDAAIVALLALEGVKVTELINLRWSDYLPASAGASLHFAGTRERHIGLSPRTSAFLATYREATKSAGIKGTQHVFVAFKGRETLASLPKMTRHGVKFMLYEQGEKAGIEGLNAERLRHYAINALLASGKTVEEVMRHLGVRRPGLIGKHLAMGVAAANAASEHG